MNALDNLTVCITSFRRGKYLERAIASCEAAGIRRIAIAAVEPDQEVLAVISRFDDPKRWLSFDVATLPVDVGCNNTWMLAAYRSRTERIIVLHDDDVLTPEFGPTYLKTIAPIMDSGIGLASWRANHLFDDGTTHVTEYWSGPSRVMPSKELNAVVARYGTLSLSPVVSVLNRTVTIRACKEAAATLTHNDCLHRPGMLLGTEILVYLRHIKAFPNWLYVDQLLSMYGHHEDSGTVALEKTGNLAPLVKGYDRARSQGLMNGPPTPKPKLIFVHSLYCPDDSDELRRIENAKRSWDFHFASFEAIELAIHPANVRNGDLYGDERPTAHIRDLLDAGAAMAMPEDLVVFSNSDIALTVDAPARLIAGVERGKGVTICPRRNMENPVPGRLYRTVKNCRVDGGMDVIAMTPAWWEEFRTELPDMLIGREAWDLCLRTLAEEWADGGGLRSGISVQPEEWWRSRAYADDVCWHEPHASFWKVERKANPGGAHNRKLARAFFEARNNHVGLRCVQEPMPTVNVNVVPASKTIEAKETVPAT